MYPAPPVTSTVINDSPCRSERYYVRDSVTGTAVPSRGNDMCFGFCQTCGCAGGRVVAWLEMRAEWAKELTNLTIQQGNGLETEK